MKLHFCAQALAGCGIALSAIAAFNQPSYAQDKFFCGTSNGQPVTIVRHNRLGNIPIIRWVDTSFPLPWTPQARCEEISTRFQQFYDNGTLKYIKGGWLDHQPVFCVAAHKKGNCLSNGLLVTLKPGTDPNLTLMRLLDKRVFAPGKPIDLVGGESDEDLIAEVNGEVYFNIESFLAEDKSSTSETNESPKEPVWEW